MRPLFCRGKRAIGKSLFPLQSPLLIQFAEKGSPDLQPDALLFPIPQPPPACARGRILSPGQVLPSRPTPQHPEDAFETRPITNWPAASFGRLFRFGKQRSDLGPLFVGQISWLSLLSGHGKISFHNQFYTVKPCFSGTPRGLALLSFETASSQPVAYRRANSMSRPRRIKNAEDGTRTRTACNRYRVESPARLPFLRALRRILRRRNGQGFSMGLFMGLSPDRSMSAAL
jgi:hypothetical protein